VVTELFAVVRGQHHDGVVALAQLVEAVQELAERGVDFGDHPEVRGLQLTLVQVVGGGGHHHERALEERMDGTLGLGRLVANRGGHVGRVEHVVVRRRGQVRRVGPQVRQVRAPGPVVGSHRLLEPLECRLGDERRLGVLGRIDRRCPRGAPVGRGLDVGLLVDVRAVGGDVVALVLEPLAPRLDALVEQHAQPEPVHRLLPAAVARVAVGQLVRVERRVGVAEQHRVVVQVPEQARQHRQVVAQRGAVAHHAVVHLPQPGEQRGPARRAGRAVGEVVREPDAVGRQPVQVRRLHERVSGHPQTVGPELVERDQQDVRAVGHPRSLSVPHRFP
jgi:hypothetical protein